MAKTMRGLTDEAATRDLFNIQRYIDGLTEFISTCNTPMTISIQGSWGTGKTSVMQIIDRGLAERSPQTTHTIWFNTWQFSQFNMDDDLAVSLLSCLLTELADSEEQKSAARMMTEALRAVGRVGKGLFLSAVENNLGGSAAEAVGSVLTRDIDPASTIKDLREKFAACVDEKLRHTGKDRVVVFIDDLDRLTPRRAVELLEVLKLFLDCENCVFVLAIDYAVVCRGVEAKYGDLADDRAASAEKGRSFFDKIIQVPFKMPVAEYDIKNYVETCLKQIGISCTGPELSTYVDLIRTSIGANPRSMKRLFNAYLLLTIVVGQNVLNTDKSKQVLFGVLCMQHAFEKLYNFIVEQREKLDYSLLKGLAESESREALEEQAGEGTPDFEIVSRAQPFLEVLLYKVIDVDQDGTLSDRELESLRNVLNTSTMTSAVEEGPVKPSRRDYIVGALREMELSAEMEQKTEQLLETYRSLGPDVQIVYMKSASKHINVQNGAGKNFSAIYFRQHGFAIDFSRRFIDETDPEIASVVARYLHNPTDRIITIKVEQWEGPAWQDFLTITHGCYNKSNA